MSNVASVLFTLTQSIIKLRVFIRVYRVRTTVIREDLTSNVNAPTSAPSQASYLPETTGMRVGAYSYLVIQLTPLASGTTFNAASVVQIPCTFYTLANASGQ